MALTVIAKPYLPLGEGLLLHGAEQAVWVQQGLPLQGDVTERHPGGGWTAAESAPPRAAYSSHF